MPALAAGLLIAVTLINLALVARSKAAAPALAADPPSAPSTPEPSNGKPEAPKQAAPAKKPAHPPFVPATRVVAEMEKLFASDPAAGLRAAAAAVLNEKERRSEVKIGAMRILDQGPFSETRAAYADVLKLASRNGIQTSKEVGIDPWWYLQRESLKKLAREIESLKPASPELVDLLKTVYKDRNASVRLAAAEVLAALGVDPGAEPSYARPELKLPPSARPGNQLPQPRQQMQGQKPGGGKWFWIVLMAAILGWMTYTNLNRPAPAPKAPVAIEQVQRDSTRTAPADTVKVAPSEKQSLDEIARNTERTAEAIEKQAQALERQAKATEEMAKPKGMGMGNILMMAAMAILPIFLLVWLLRRMQGGGGAAGGIQMKPKMDLEKPTTRFDDVAGIDETMVEVQEILDFLRDPGRFKRLGARMPKGILMEGPPGTGKTLLARALAGETDATFISISGSDFVELYVGMGARRVRELFETARQNAPAIIFIDEIDAVGKKRGDGGPGNGGNDEREQTINQILKEMDGFDNSSGVLVVAATNRADTLDAALTRPGRFDRKIHVGLPEAMGREAILALHAKKARLGPDVDLRLIARRTAGLSGAFLENVINEAALLAARRGGDAINGADIDEAVDRATIGGKRSLRLSDALKRRIAAHEAGHVLANLLNEKAELRSPVNKVTIIPHGSGALGFAESGGEDGERYLYTRGELEARLDTALGGLIAEKIYYGEWSTGPGSDLESATRVARAMVQQLGMDPELGLAQTGPNQYGQSAFGSEIDGKAHAAVNKLLKESMERTEKRLRDNKDKHDAMIEALMEKETLSADEIVAISHPKPKP
jgi:cell division protease FtsH